LEFQRHRSNRLPGSAVYVYGAPKAFIKVPFASQHVCINDVCHIVDVEQAYVNAQRKTVLQSVGNRALNPLQSDSDEQGDLETTNIITLSGPHPELEPVLIWSMTGLDDQVQHNLRLALAMLPSVDNAEMSIVKVVYTKVSYRPGESRPDTPIPQPGPEYEGSLFPPHARRWESQNSTMPLPTPTASLPSLPTHPQPSSDVSGTAVLLASLNILLIISLVLVYIGRSRNAETQFLLPNPPLDDDPPPLYGTNNQR
jgi:hypothetical protein